MFTAIYQLLRLRNEYDTSWTKLVTILFRFCTLCNRPLEWETKTIIIFNLSKVKKILTAKKPWPYSTYIVLVEVILLYLLTLFTCSSIFVHTSHKVKRYGTYSSLGRGLPPDDVPTGVLQDGHVPLDVHRGQYARD